jgi:hypothetical protein
LGGKIDIVAQCLGGNAAVFVVLVLISLSAYAPMLESYQLVEDDYWTFAKTAIEWFETWGIWRIAGLQLARSLVAIHAYGIAIILWHALNGYLFYLVARSMFGCQSFAFFLSIVITAFPWGYQSIIWATALPFVGASTALWAIIYVLLTFELEQTRCYPLAAGIAGLSLLGLMFNEAIFFSLCAAGIIIWARPGLIRRGKAAAIVVSAAPLVGALAWAAIYEVTKPEEPIKAVGVINIRSVFSAIYYQYSNLEVFEVLTHRPLREYAISTIQPVLLGVALVSLAASLVLITLIARRWLTYESEAKFATREVMRPLAQMVCMLLLLFGATGIYALGGGYSLDSHKRYVIVPLLVMTAAATFWAIKPRRLSWPWRSASTIGTFCAVGCVTSFLMLSLWHHELTRVNELADIIAQNRLDGPVRVEWNPKLTDIWSHATRSWGDPIDGLPLRLALHGRGVDGVIINPDASTHIIWDGKTQHWVVRR